MVFSVFCCPLHLYVLNYRLPVESTLRCGTQDEWGIGQWPMADFLCQGWHSWPRAYSTSKCWPWKQTAAWDKWPRIEIGKPTLSQKYAGPKQEVLGLRCIIVTQCNRRPFWGGGGRAKVEEVYIGKHPAMMLKENGHLWCRQTGQKVTEITLSMTVHWNPTFNDRSLTLTN